MGEREKIAAVIEFYHSKGCPVEFEQITNTMLGDNKLAFNAFAWHLVDCKVQNAEVGPAMAWKNKVLNANPNDADMTMRSKFYDVMFRVEHLTTNNDYHITQQDIDALADVANSGTSFSLPACYLLLPHAPERATCFATSSSAKKENLKEEKNITDETSEIFLGNNFPNPFAHTTIIPYRLSENINEAYIRIYDVVGKMVKSYKLNKDENALTVPIADFGNGIYIYALEADNMITAKKKMVIIK